MDDIDEVYKNSGLGKWFHKQSAGGEPGWDRYNSKGEKAGKCGDSKPGEPYAACLSKQKAAKLGKKGVKSFVLRKRAKQRDAGKGKKDIAGKGNKPVNVKTGVTDKDPNKRGIQEMGKAFEDFRGDLQEKNVPTNPKLWSSVISQARSKFDVYPSAYANAWASKEYKKKGGGWRKSKGKVDEALMVALGGGLQEGYKFKKTKTEKNKSEEGNQTIVHFDIMQNGKKIGQIKVDDYFGKMVGTVHGKNIPNGMHGHPDTIQKDFDGFMKSKTAQRLFKGNMREKVEQVDEKSAAWQRKEGKNREGGLNAAGRRSYERENPGSDLKAPVSAAQAKKSKGGKAAKRRKSFCARMGGMPGPMKDEKGRPTRKALALRKWDC